MSANGNAALPRPHLGCHSSPATSSHGVCELSTRINRPYSSFSISNSQTESADGVMSEIPAPSFKPILRSPSGVSSSPKKSSQPDRSTIATPLDCPDTSSRIFSPDTEWTEHSNSVMPFFHSAINLMLALDSAHPLTTDATSSKDAEITALSFLLNCETIVAEKWHPFFRETLQRAKSKLPH
jgi:hypothetical protein